MSDIHKTEDLAVSVKNLTRSADGDIYRDLVLCDVSFSFKRRGVHCILAPKHSGKTQIMDILGGCDRADGGEVSVLGGDPCADLTVRKKIGYLRKNNSLYSNMTVTETMSFVGECKGVEQGKLYRQIKEALELVGMEEIKNRLVARLTEHEKKKLSLAASLLGNPDLLLLDEPIDGKTSDDRREVFERIISMLGRIKTVIFTTEELSIARALSEDVVIVSDGRVLACGSFEELDGRLKDSESPTTLEALYKTLTCGSAE